MEKAMAPHSSTLAWKIPGTEEPGRLQSMGSLRVRHNWATSLSIFTFMHWRRKRQPTLFLPGESQGWGSLVGCRLWGCTESDTTEAMQQQQQQLHNVSVWHYGKNFMEKWWQFWPWREGGGWRRGRGWGGIIMLANSNREKVKNKTKNKLEKSFSR